jgi:hypothetical protein
MLTNLGVENTSVNHKLNRFTRQWTKPGFFCLKQLDIKAITAMQEVIFQYSINK